MAPSATFFLFRVPPARVHATKNDPRKQVPWVARVNILKIVFLWGPSGRIARVRGSDVLDFLGLLGDQGFDLRIMGLGQIVDALLRALDLVVAQFLIALSRIK